MSLEERINADIKSAMLAKEKENWTPSEPSNLPFCF